jgi:hypothetical protein
MSQAILSNKIVYWVPMRTYADKADVISGKAGEGIDYFLPPLRRQLSKPASL